MLENFTLGFCAWDIPAAAAFVGAAFILFNQQRNHRKRMKDAAQLLKKRNRSISDNQEQTTDRQLTDD